LDPSQTILKVISNNNAIILISAIAKGQYYEDNALEGQNTIDKTVTNPTRTRTITTTTKEKTVNLSSAKFHSGLMTLAKIGIIEKKECKYVLTLPGKIVYQYQMLIGAGLDNYWKLKVLDSLGVYDVERVSIEARAEIIDSLIGNQEMKDILKF
jgi:hypothetical protein